MRTSRPRIFSTPRASASDEVLAGEERPAVRRRVAEDVRALVLRAGAVAEPLEAVAALERTGPGDLLARAAQRERVVLDDDLDLAERRSGRPAFTKSVPVQAPFSLVGSTCGREPRWVSSAIQSSTNFCVSGLVSW